MVESEIIKTLKIPSEVTITANEQKLTIKTSKGEVTKDFENHRTQFEIKNNSIIITGKPVNKQTTKLMNTMIANIENLVYGLQFGFKYEMKINYSHFPMTAEVKENKILIKNFLGEKYPRTARIIDGTKVEVKGADIIITGLDLSAVSQTMANIRLATKVKNKDIRRFTDGVYLSKKGHIEEIPEEFKFQIIKGRE